MTCMEMQINENRLRHTWLKIPLSKSVLITLVLIKPFNATIQ